MTTETRLNELIEEVLPPLDIDSILSINMQSVLQVQLEKFRTAILSSGEFILVEDVVRVAEDYLDPEWISEESEFLGALRAKASPSDTTNALYLPRLEGTLGYVPTSEEQ